LAGRDVIDALQTIEPAWDELFPAAQARVAIFLAHSPRFVMFASVRVRIDRTAGAPPARLYDKRCGLRLSNL